MRISDWSSDVCASDLHKGLLAESLKSSKAHFETPCGSFADMKLARYLTSFTGEAQYGDGLERILYNTMLATRLPDSDGDYPYYSNYGAGGERSEEHKSELQSLMRIPYAVFCLKKKKKKMNHKHVPLY